MDWNFWSFNTVHAKITKKNYGKCCRIEFFYRAIFICPRSENVRAKQAQQTNGNRAIWLVYRTDTDAGGFWLVKRTLAWKNFMLENFLEINRYFALTSYCNMIGQSNNAFSILGFSLAENEEAMFWSFHPFADKTNNRTNTYWNYFSRLYENRSFFFVSLQQHFMYGLRH